MICMYYISLHGLPSLMPENAIINNGWLSWIVDILPGAQLYLFIITRWNKKSEKIVKKGNWSHDSYPILLICRLILLLVYLHTSVSYITSHHSHEKIRSRSLSAFVIPSHIYSNIDWGTHARMQTSINRQNENDSEFISQNVVCLLPDDNFHVKLNELREKVTSEKKTNNNPRVDPKWIVHSQSHAK